ncbi:MAG: GTP-binding protein, partial [Bryobacteraceae bacterium]
MKLYEGADVRNIGLVGHGHSGKTSLAAALLYTAGASSRLTRVDEGNTLTDFDDEEIHRKLTVATAAALVEWKKKKLNLLDTPGFNLFIYDTKAALAASDSAIVVVDGVSGVEVQTEKVWSFADELKLPRLVAINKLDRERSSFSRSLESVQSVFGRAAVPVQLPVGEERDFKSIVDLVRMKVYSYTHDGDGKGQESDIPPNLAGAAQAAHEQLVE